MFHSTPSTRPASRTEPLTDRHKSAPHPFARPFEANAFESGLRELADRTPFEFPREQVEVLGRLDDAWSGAGHLLVPIVGWLNEAPQLRANPAEVEAIHSPRVSGFFAPEAYSLESNSVNGVDYFNPTLRWEDAQVYGLSADLLIEVVQYALGLPVPHGPGRLDNLRTYYRDT